MVAFNVLGKSFHSPAEIQKRFIGLNTLLQIKVIPKSLVLAVKLKIQGTALEIQSRNKECLLFTKQ